MNYIQVFIEARSLYLASPVYAVKTKRGEIAYPESEKNRNDMIFVL